MPNPKMSRNEALAFNRKMRVFSGNPPHPDKGWFHVMDTAGEYQGTPWRVYMRERHNLNGNPEGPWWQVKVIAGFPLRSRANYWLAHNGRRWANAPDLQDVVMLMSDILHEIEPAVVERIPVSEQEDAELAALGMV